MEHINKHLNKAGKSTSTQSTGNQESDELDIDTKLLFNRIFKELVAIYPAWKQAFDNEDAVGASKRQWAKGIKENNISQWEIIEDALGLCRAAGGAFIPAIGTFIGYCHQAAMKRLGALETMTAYKHLLGYYALSVEHREPCALDPLVYHMISQADFDVLGFKTMRSENSVKYFSENYQEVLKYALAGGVIKKPIVPDKRIGNPSGVVHTKNNKDRGNSALTNLKAMFK